MNLMILLFFLGLLSIIFSIIKWPNLKEKIKSVWQMKRGLYRLVVYNPLSIFKQSYNLGSRMKFNPGKIKNGEKIKNGICKNAIFNYF